MKNSVKQLLSPLFVAAWVFVVVACGDDDPSAIEDPTVIAGIAGTVQVGQSVSISFSINAPGSIANVSVSTTAGTATVTNGIDLTGQISGTANVDYTAPADAGTAVITLTVTDNEGNSDDAFLTVTITDEPVPEVVDVFTSPDGTGSVTWTADKIYVLRGFIFVNDGQTLTIEPGTVIKGQPGQGAGASALIVAKGGKIMAEGTADAPIIFTGLADDLQGSVADDANALWGGVILLGNASTNNNDGLRNIEGIPTDDSRGQYGSTTPDDDDNSGTMTYVSIRHGGSLIGSDNEINGLTLGAVGSKTTLENIEIYSNLDDGVEFFGGTASINGLVITYPGDDGIDIDEGYNGTVQKAISWHTTATLESGDPREEWDGGDGANEGEEPYALPKLANITFVYDDADAANANMSRALYWRDNNGTSVYNSIVYGFDNRMEIEWRGDKGTDTDSDGIKEGSSFFRWKNGDLNIVGNTFYNINGSADDLAVMFSLGDADNSNDPDPSDETDIETYLANNNETTDPAFGSGTDKFKPGASLTGTSSLPSGITDLGYVGAVDPSAATPFFAGWTKTWTVLGGN